MFYMPVMPLALFITIPLLVVGGISLIFGGAFIGSQIDDKIENLGSPLPAPLKNIPYWITLPAIIALSFFGIKVAKKWSKKI